jgi:hypothetical protein
MHEHAFKNLKRMCDESKALKPLDYEQIKTGRVNVFLVTDASKVGTGAFICHGHKYEDAKRNIAALHSRKFSASQENYHTTDQECLAIVDALKAFETRLLGIPFTIVTDHQALQYMISNEIKSSRQMRWMDYIQRFNFEIRYEPGGTNLLADALSRIYYDIRTDEIQPEEQVIDMEKDEKWMPPKQHLNKEEFPTNFPDHHLETQRITNLLQRSSIREQTTSIPHVMAMSIPRRPECDIGLHWSLCKLRRGKGPSCPFHYSTAGFTTYSEYMDMEVYKRNLEEWDAKYGPSSASYTTEFTNSELVYSEVSGIQKRTRRSRRQMAKRHPKPPSESNETDEDGYPLRIKWITSNESEENSPMERSYFRDTTFRNTRGGTVNKEPLSHVVTRSKAKITNEEDCKTVGYVEVRHRFRRYSSDETCLA